MCIAGYVPSEVTVFRERWASNGPRRVTPVKDVGRGILRISLKSDRGCSAAVVCCDTRAKKCSKEWASRPTVVGADSERPRTAVDSSACMAHIECPPRSDRDLPHVRPFVVLLGLNEPKDARDDAADADGGPGNEGGDGGRSFGAGVELEVEEWWKDVHDRDRERSADKPDNHPRVRDRHRHRGNTEREHGGRQHPAHRCRQSLPHHAINHQGAQGRAAFVREQRDGEENHDGQRRPKVDGTRMVPVVLQDVAGHRVWVSSRPEHADDPVYHRRGERARSHDRGEVLLRPGQRVHERHHVEVARERERDDREAVEKTEHAGRLAGPECRRHRGGLGRHDRHKSDKEDAHPERGHRDELQRLDPTDHDRGWQEHNHGRHQQQHGALRQRRRHAPRCAAQQLVRDDVPERVEEGDARPEVVEQDEELHRVLPSRSGRGSRYGAVVPRGHRVGGGGGRRVGQLLHAHLGEAGRQQHHQGKPDKPGLAQGKRERHQRDAAAKHRVGQVEDRPGDGGMAVPLLRGLSVVSPEERCALCCLEFKFNEPISLHRDRHGQGFWSWGRGGSIPMHPRRRLHTLGRSQHHVHGDSIRSTWSPAAH
eukprot:m.160026 g.160026  ORF g.160026 m.160026 type:complete len:595 (+) comp23776_c0_seq1:21-1805(+)